MSLAQAQPARRMFPPALIIVLASFAIALLLPGWAAAKGGGKHHHGKHHGHPGKGKVVNVMTRNVYLGADLAPAIGAGSLKELVTANGVIFREVLANDFPTRAQGLADEILRTKPDLVGLQEVALWTTTPITPAGRALNLDYLQLLLADLNRGKGGNGKGKPQYRVVVVQEEFGTESPADVNGVENDGPGGDLADAEVLGKLTMRDVILVRRGSGARTWNAQGGNFSTQLQLPIAGQLVDVRRGWTATDAKVRGSHPFRFVNTHLEAFHPLIREAQAKELVASGGPATSNSLPVVLLGDLNSDDDTVLGADQLAYQALLSADMVNRSTDDPLSCCLNSSLLAVGAGGSVADFDHQVDHILTSDEAKVKLQSSTVTGLLPVNGYWDSDHAGVFSALEFLR